MQTFPIFLAESVVPLVAGLAAILLVGILILANLTNLAKRQRQRREEKRLAILDQKVAETREKELEWYREKRFLMERQAREKQERLAFLVDFMAPEKSHRLTYPASRLFFLAETIREERQYLGTDISKLAMIDRRLMSLGKEFMLQSGKGSRAERWLSEMSLCRQMIQSNLEDLRKSQNALRTVLSGVVQLEEQAVANAISESSMARALTVLQETRRKLAELPDGLRTVAKSTGEKAQALFKEATLYLPEQGLHELWREQMNFDLFSSKHRSGGRSDLLAAADAAISSLHAVSVSVPVGAASFWNEDARKEKRTEPTPPEVLPAPVSSPASEKPKFPAGDDQKQSPPAVAPPPSPEPHPVRAALAALKSDGSGSLQRPALTPDPPVCEDWSRHWHRHLLQASQAPAPSPALAEWSREWPRRLLQAAALNTEPDRPAAGAGAEPKKKIISNPFAAPAGIEWRGESSENPSAPPGIKGFENSSLVIFRSNNPEIWNSTCENGENERALALNEIFGDARWLGIKRLDTGDEVFSEITWEALRSDGAGQSAGFNGSNEYFYGARHLGFFSEECATEVETRFTYGGWGFGHLSSANEIEAQKQACCWNGKRIPDGTVFEFTLYEDRPSHCQDSHIVA